MEENERLMKNNYEVRLVGEKEGLVKNKSNGHSYNVSVRDEDPKKHFCSCFRWIQNGIPCPHIVCLVNDLASRGDPIRYIDCVKPFCKKAYCRAELDLITSMSLTNDIAVNHLFDRMRGEGECQLTIIQEDIPPDEGVTTKRIASRGEVPKSRTCVMVCFYCGKVMHKKRAHDANSQQCIDYARRPRFIPPVDGSIDDMDSENDSDADNYDINFDDCASEAFREHK